MNQIVLSSQFVVHNEFSVIEFSLKLIENYHTENLLKIENCRQAMSLSNGKLKTAKAGGLV